MTNLFLVWNSCGCNISIATCGAGENRAWLSIAVNLDALFHDIASEANDETPLIMLEALDQDLLEVQFLAPDWPVLGQGQLS